MIERGQIEKKARRVDDVGKQRIQQKERWKERIWEDDIK